jgi:hypothetical protein
VELAALAAELELHAASRYARMPVAQRREAEGVVLLRVALVADAEARRLEQRDQRGEHLFAWQPGPLQVRARAAADRGQRLRELEHAVELVGVA